MYYTEHATEWGGESPPPSAKQADCFAEASMARMSLPQRTLTCSALPRAIVQQKDPCPAHRPARGAHATAVQTWTAMACATQKSQCDGKTLPEQANSHGVGWAIQRYRPQYAPRTVFLDVVSWG